MTGLFQRFSSSQVIYFLSGNYSSWEMAERRFWTLEWFNDSSARQSGVDVAKSCRRFATRHLDVNDRSIATLGRRWNREDSRADSQWRRQPNHFKKPDQNRSRKCFVTIGFSRQRRNREDGTERVGHLRRWQDGPLRLRVGDRRRRCGQHPLHGDVRTDKCLLHPLRHPHLVAFQQPSDGHPSKKIETFGSI